MKNSTFILDVLFIPMIALPLWIIQNMVIAGIIMAIFVILYFIINTTEMVYKLSFPYTSDEIIILNLMKIINWIIGKQFQIRFKIRKLFEMKLNDHILISDNDKTILMDSFYRFDADTWRKDFPWGNANNKPENVWCYKKLFIRMAQENFIGFWDGERHFHNTTGMIYSNNAVYSKAIFEAKIKLSSVNYINQAFCLYNLNDEYSPKRIEEIDIFEYHLTENKISMSQHWGNGYTHEENHRQDTFSVKVNLSDNKYHYFKIKITKRNMFWYVDNILIKWHFIGVPKMDQHIAIGMGNVNSGKDITDTGKLNLNELPAIMYCDWIKVTKNK